MQGEEAPFSISKVATAGGDADAAEAAVAAADAETVVLLFCHLVTPSLSFYHSVSLCPSCHVTTLF